MFWAVGRPFAKAGAWGEMRRDPWGDAGKGPRQRELISVEQALTYSVPGTVVSIVHMLTHLIHTTNL